MILAAGIAPGISAQNSTPAVASDARPIDHHAAEAILSKRVSLDVVNSSLSRALDAIAATSGTRVQYRVSWVRQYPQPITIHVADMPLRSVLERVLAGTSLQAVVMPGGAVGIILAPDGTSNAIAQAGAITGRVADAKTGRPIAGAAVTLDGATRGVVTDEEGIYRLPSVSAGTHTLLVKAIGYMRYTRQVTVADGEATTATVALQASANVLDQIIVTGTVAPTTLKAVPNAITVVTAKQIEERGITRIDQLFRGDVPGLFAPNQGAATFLDEVTMFSRGATALSGASVGVSSTVSVTNPIKTYVDGVELADPQYLSQIDPKSIERIEIVPGPQASTIYGSNAINGVMQIFTKRGTTSTPQLTLNLLSGWVENNFSSALTPQHDYSAQLSGMEGRIAYNAGGSWNYIGPWTPAKQTTRLSGFGGFRLTLPTAYGAVTSDFTLRRTNTQNMQRGSPSQVPTAYRASGWYSLTFNAFGGNGVNAPTTYSLAAQTLGLVLTYSPTTWWTHELGLGQDTEMAEQRTTAFGYADVSDTTLTFSPTSINRRTLHYTGTVQMPITSWVQATLLAGADAWQLLSTSLSVSPQTLTGTLTNVNFLNRQPDHNTGAFLQTQLGVSDRLFLTYGLRAEWNPNYGAAAQPNYAPRIGVAYTQDFGPATAKVRASYGRSTRPPARGDKTAIDARRAYGAATVAAYGNFSYQLANPDLGPEHQQGGEGGLELYLGTRGSLVITRYNQTVDGLIDQPKVDSVRSLLPNPSESNTLLDPNGYGYRYQYQYLNIGSIRNQGWELQSTVNAGRLAFDGTYNWTKSRTIGVTPKYRAQFLSTSAPQYQVGATFNALPEHTWALGTTYTSAKTTLALRVNGVGRNSNGSGNDFFQRNLDARIRLSAYERFRIAAGSYISHLDPYALANMTATRAITSRATGVCEMQNLANRYTNELYSIYPVMGRQTRVGVRVKW